MHTDPRRLTPTDGLDRNRAGISRRDVFRTLLWLVLVVCVIGNTVASYRRVGMAVNYALGGVTALCIVMLVVCRPRSRR